ncbi:MAG TPA: hypothetical protein VH186_27645 [Chloroflexia bacterium]|nr:hypothetical protein [Chloroflexia bacterium]
MKYHNWQKTHKEIYDGWGKKPVSISTLEDIHARAWRNLLRFCTPEELKKLSELAARYQCGEILS